MTRSTSSHCSPIISPQRSPASPPKQDDHMTKSSETLQVNEAEQRDYDAEIDRVVCARRTDRCVTSY